MTVSAKRALAAFFTPVVVLASAHDLYLRNQLELDRTVSVLYPFWAAAALLVLLTLLLQAVDRAPARAALVAIYAAGAGFLAWGLLRSLPPFGYLTRWILDSGPGAALFALAWLALTVGVGRRHGPPAIEPLAAVLAVTFAAYETSVLATRLQSPPEPALRDPVAGLQAAADPTRPNVYHFILDALQDESLEPSLSPSAAAALDGFVRFRATAPVHTTVRALPRILTGREPAAGDHGALRAALGGEANFVRDLRRAGYQTLAFVPRTLFAAMPSPFDRAVFHEENVPAADLRSLQAATFRRLWAYLVLPRSLGESLARGRLFGLETGFFLMRPTDRLSTFAQPIHSRLSLERITDLESGLAPGGRYTLIHVILPHGPYILRPDCSYGGAGEPTGIAPQTECTLLLLSRFLDELRRLDRFDDSVILVHGDHGAGERIVDGGTIGDETAWSRTALLVKPVRARGPMRRADRIARLVDIAPTLLALLGLEPGRSFDGSPLIEAP